MCINMFHPDSGSAVKENAQLKFVDCQMFRTYGNAVDKNQALKYLYRNPFYILLSSPGHSPGRAIVLPPTSALVSALALVLAR